MDLKSSRDVVQIRIEDLRISRGWERRLTKNNKAIVIYAIFRWQFHQKRLGFFRRAGVLP
jgi:hypothetical protein